MLERKYNRPIARRFRAPGGSRLNLRPGAWPGEGVHKHISGAIRQMQGVEGDQVPVLRIEKNSLSPGSIPGHAIARQQFGSPAREHGDTAPIEKRTVRTRSPSNHDPVVVLVRIGIAAVVKGSEQVVVTSLVHQGRYYYLFASFDDCCNPDPYQDNYRIMVGRGSSPHGPFLDRSGISMLAGGGTELLAGNGATWNAPGGETVFLDPQNGDLITFHALHLPDGAAYVFVNSLTWPSAWPQIQP